MCLSSSDEALRLSVFTFLQRSSLHMSRERRSSLPSRFTPSGCVAGNLQASSGVMWTEEIKQKTHSRDTSLPSRKVADTLLSATFYVFFFFFPSTTTDRLIKCLGFFFGLRSESSSFALFLGDMTCLLFTPTSSVTSWLNYEAVSSSPLLLRCIPCSGIPEVTRDRDADGRSPRKCAKVSTPSFNPLFLCKSTTRVI